MAVSRIDMYASLDPNNMPTVKRSVIGTKDDVEVQFVVGGCAVDVSVTQKQARSLREAITKALGEQPQDESPNEQLQSAVSDAEQAIEVLKRIAHIKPNTTAPCG